MSNIKSSQNIKIAKVKIKLPEEFPPVPIRGLWRAVTIEEREKAKMLAQVIMEYWTGELTK